MKVLRILVIDKLHPSIVPLLENQGHEVTFLPDIKAPEVAQLIPDFDGLVLQSKIRIDSSFLDHAPNLKFVARSGSGLDLIDLEELKRRNIQLISSPEGNRNAVGEHTIGIILALLNHFVKADQEVRKFIWDREGNRGNELINKTVAIIGYGNMGQSVASKLQAFGCTILVYDKYHTGFKHPYVHESSMEEVYEKSDIVTFHIPLTDETKLMVNESYLERFKKPIWLINAARGEILDTKALILKLESGKIIAAGLDVLENEKLSTLTPEQQLNLEKLASMTNVLLSPHVAGWSHESNIRNNEVLASKIAANSSLF